MVDEAGAFIHHAIKPAASRIMRSKPPERGRKE
jgi:hypothetical protein